MRLNRMLNDVIQNEQEAIQKKGILIARAEEGERYVEKLEDCSRFEGYFENSPQS